MKRKRAVVVVLLGAGTVFCGRAVGQSEPSTVASSASTEPATTQADVETEPVTAPSTSPATLPTTTTTTSQPAPTAASTQPTTGPAQPPPFQLKGVPEGTIFRDRVGRMLRVKGDREMHFIYNDAGKGVEVGVLQNLELMRVENAIDASGSNLLFRITGVLTEYNGINHLLLEHADLESPAASSAPTTQPVTMPAP